MTKSTLSAAFPDPQLAHALEALRYCASAFNSPDGKGWRFVRGTGDHEEFLRRVRGALATIERSPRWPLLEEIAATIEPLARNGDVLVDAATAHRIHRLVLLSRRQAVGRPWRAPRPRHDVLAALRHLAPGARAAALRDLWTATGTHGDAVYVFLVTVAAVRGEDAGAVAGPLSMLQGRDHDAAAHRVAESVAIGAAPFPKSVRAAVGMLVADEPAATHAPAAAIRRDKLGRICGIKSIRLYIRGELGAKVDNEPLSATLEEWAAQGRGVEKADRGPKSFTYKAAPGALRGIVAYLAP